MNMIGLVIATIVMIAAGLLHNAFTGMLKQEFGTRLAGLPKQLIHIAGKRLPIRIRAEYLDEWLSELDYVLRETDGLPVTRLIRGSRYAAGVLLAARAIGRDEVKEREPLLTDATPRSLLPNALSFYIANPNAHCLPGEDRPISKPCLAIRSRSRRLIALAFRSGNSAMSFPTGSMTQCEE